MLCEGVLVSIHVHTGGRGFKIYGFYCVHVRNMYIYNYMYTYTYMYIYFMDDTLNVLSEGR